MNQLVWINPARHDAVPYTTSDVIAEYAGVKSSSVYRLIEKHQKALEGFGRVVFQIRPFETKGGTQDKKICPLNEQQATFLITMLRNTPQVVAFKAELVRQFYAMREELLKCQLLRKEGKPRRRTLTDAIQDAGGGTWAYKNTTDLIYKQATGKTAKQLRQERGADPKAIAADFLTSSELEKYQRLEQQVIALYDIGIDYQGIKGLITGAAVPVLKCQ